MWEKMEKKRVRMFGKKHFVFIISFYLEMDF